MLYFIESKRSSFFGAELDWVTIAFYVTVAVALSVYVRYAWLTLDKVYDSGNSLILVRRGLKREITYSQIDRIKIGDNDDNSSHAEIHLISSIDLGKKFNFIPAIGGKFSGKLTGRLYEIQDIVKNSKNE